MKVPRAAQRIVVLGAGQTGCGVAEVAAVGGATVRLVDRDTERVDAALRAIEASTEVAMTRGKLDESARQDALGRITAGVDVAAACADAELLIEATREDLDHKREILQEAARHLPARAVIATNTTTLSITEIASGLADPSRAVGMHFFTPVPKTRLCEIVRGLQSSAEAVALAEATAWAMGRSTIVVSDQPGFVTTRLSALLGNEAMRMLQERVASPAAIDTAMRLGLNHPMGPLEVLDHVGLDIRLMALEHLALTLGDRFRPTPLHRQLVAAGRLGRKSGHGIYRYDANGHRIGDDVELPD